MNKKEVPVLLLTGYLGSGKTTLLNRILANERGIRFAVIVNDIGEVNIDADLIQKGGIVNQQDDSLVALQNGCICCTLKMDLIEQLREITAMERFDYIVIEASGICEPAPIAQTICSIPAMGPQYMEHGIVRLDSIVTVVDALRMRDEFGNGDQLTRENIGEEDIESADFKIDSFISKYEWLLYQLHTHCELCTMYIISVMSDNPKAVKLNRELAKLAKDTGCVFINVAHNTPWSFISSVKPYIRSFPISFAEAMQYAG